MRSWVLDQLRQLEYEVAQLGIQIDKRREIRRMGTEPIEESAGGHRERKKGTMPLYARFYGLARPPFSLTPDPAFLYLGEGHREALARLLYGVQERKGFVLITGEVGTGKTTLIHALLQRLGSDTRVAFLFNTTSMDSVGLLWYTLEDLGEPVDRGEDFPTAFHRLNAFLIERAEAGENVALIVDEAQNLDPTMLEAIRQLSNLETSTTKLLQILLVGQPELAEKLARPGLRQLRQRIGVEYCLSSLDRSDTERYILHRLSVAGSSGAELFTKKAMRAIYRASGGIPRRINLLCDGALLAGYVRERRTVNHRIVREVAREREQRLRAHSGRLRRLLPLAASAAAAGLIAAGGLYYTRTGHRLPGLGTAEVRRGLGPETGGFVSAGMDSVAGDRVDRLVDSVLKEDATTVRLAYDGSLIVRVRRGDTLSRIAERVYGERSDWVLQRILEANSQIEDINYIKAGWFIRLPPLTSVEAE